MISFCNQGILLLLDKKQTLTFDGMDNNMLMGSIILGIIGMVVWFYFLELTILGAMKKYKKWENEENAKKTE